MGLLHTFHATAVAEASKKTGTYKEEQSFAPCRCELCDRQSVSPVIVARGAMSYPEAIRGEILSCQREQEGIMSAW